MANRGERRNKLNIQKVLLENTNETEMTGMSKLQILMGLMMLNQNYPVLIKNMFFLLTSLPNFATNFSTRMDIVSLLNSSRLRSST